MEHVEFEILHQWLQKIHGPDSGLPFWHGYITAVACGPRLVKPSEWQPLIFKPGGEDYVFPSDAEMNEKMGLLMQMYNELIRQVMQPVFKPYTASLEDGIEQWCRGFLVGVSLWANELKGARQTGFFELVSPIVIFTGRDTLAKDLEPKISKEAIEKIRQSLPQVIKYNIPKLRKLFLE